MVVKIAKPFALSCGGTIPLPYLVSKVRGRSLRRHLNRCDASALPQVGLASPWGSSLQALFPRGWAWRGPEGPQVPTQAAGPEQRPLEAAEDALEKPGSTAPSTWATHLALASGS